MKYDDGYLSGEELKLLISEVEEHELVTAPPDLKVSILKCIADEEAEEWKTAASVTEVKPSEEEKPPENKVVEFRKYCIKVMATVAAAVAIVFLTPAFSDSRLTETPSKDSKVSYQNYKSKEEVLKDSESVFKKIGSTQYILGNDDLFHGLKNWRLKNETEKKE